MNTATAATTYHRQGTQGDVACASPHRLISLMLSGVRRHAVAARQALKQSDVARKGEATSKAIALLEELRLSLDVEKGGDLATRLSSLYEYMVTTLVRANLHDEPEAYEEVLTLLGSIEEGWNALPGQVASEPELQDSIGRYFDAAQ